MEIKGSKICIAEGANPIDLKSISEKAASFSPFKVAEKVLVDGKECVIERICPLYSMAYQSVGNKKLHKAFVDLDKFEYEVVSRDGKKELVALNKVAVCVVKESTTYEKQYEAILKQLEETKIAKGCLNHSDVETVFSDAGLSLTKEEVEIVLEEVGTAVEQTQQSTATINLIHLDPIDPRKSIQTKPTIIANTNEQYLNKLLSEQSTDGIKTKSRSLAPVEASTELHIGDIVYKRGSSYLWEITNRSKKNSNLIYSIRSGDKKMNVWSQELKAVK